MEETKWIFCGTSPAIYSSWYEEYYSESNPKLIKRVWNDGYIEFFETV